MKPIQRLKLADELLSGDSGFDADLVDLDISNGKHVNEREKSLAQLVSRLYTLIHPAVSKCQHLDWEEENESLLRNK